MRNGLVGTIVVALAVATGGLAWLVNERAEEARVNAAWARAEEWAAKREIAESEASALADADRERRHRIKIEILYRADAIEQGEREAHAETERQRVADEQKRAATRASDDYGRYVRQRNEEARQEADRNQAKREADVRDMEARHQRDLERSQREHRDIEARYRDSQQQYEDKVARRDEARRIESLQSDIDNLNYRIRNGYRH